MADGMMGLDDPLAGMDLNLLGPSVLGGNFGTVNTDVNPGTDASAPWLFNGPSDSVFGNTTPTLDFLSSLPTENGSTFDLSTLANGLGGLSGLFGNVLSGIRSVLPDTSTAQRLIPGSMALTYAAAQPNLDLGPLNSIEGQLSGNQNAVIKAATDPLQQNIAAGYGDLLQSQSLRGIRGSSFGDTDIANYLATTGNALANAGANAAKGSLGLQSDIATQIANLQNQRQQIKNRLFGSAFDVLGRGLNPAGYAGTTNINVGTGGGGGRTSSGSDTLGDLAKIGGLAASVGSLFSDRRLKDNIVKVADDPRGFSIYTYDLLGKRQWGVMADEVEKVMPEAVTECMGYKMVNYSMLWERDNA